MAVIDLSENNSHESMANFNESSNDIVIGVGGSNNSTRTGDRTTGGSALANKETKSVSRLRILMFVVLIVTMLLTSIAVYIYSHSKEVEEFENEFYGHGLKVIDAFRADSYRKMQALETLSTVITSQAHLMNATWPYVTIPNSDTLLQPFLSMSDTVSLLILPIIPNDQRKEWENYTKYNSNWIEEEFKVRMQRSGQWDGTNSDRRLHNRDLLSSSSSSSDTAYEMSSKQIIRNHTDYEERIVAPYIKNYVGIDTSPGPWIVWWQYAPVILDKYFINFNRLAWKGFDKEAAVVQSGKVVMSSPWTFTKGIDYQSTRDLNFVNQLLIANGRSAGYGVGEPLGYIHYPIFNTNDPFETTKQNKTVTAILSATTYWKGYFEGILPDSVQGIICVVKSSAGDVFTYKVDGTEATFLGMEDLHDKNFDYMKLSAVYTSFIEAQSNNPYHGAPIDEEYINYSLYVYPSTEMEEIYLTNTPVMMTCIIISVFLFTVLVFMAYDWFVERRQRLVMQTAVTSSAVVANLFPQNVRDRLFNEAVVDDKKKRKKWSKNIMDMDEDEFDQGPKANAPIADFYPECTVFFCDIRGFTAWCSEREPEQVFILLENLYNAFDKIAKKHRVFKVETIGDCYMAVTGLPHPQQHHAVLMVRFAYDSLVQTGQILSRLEVKLGPGTTDLNIRVGMHSGAVTAGVIRGDNARFQLFGDTVNTASRMESTGEPGKIQLSESTAKYLIAAGKENWIIPRKEKIIAKGKGELQTYWLNMSQSHRDACESSNGGSESNEDTESDGVEVSNDRLTRLIEFNVKTLLHLLRGIESCRRFNNGKNGSNLSNDDEIKIIESIRKSRPIDEVVPVIDFEGFDNVPFNVTNQNGSIEIDKAVAAQLGDFVSCVAALHGTNEECFHSFDYASHTAMAIVKLLSKCEGIHPLTLFACVIASLVKDVQHPGLSNEKLVIDNPELFQVYGRTSIAEQNSFNVAWGLLSDRKFDDLRSAIYRNQPELKHFRQILVNAVLVSDADDLDIQAQRFKRWKEALSSTCLDDQIVRNARCSAIVESAMQASCVVYMMQHWHSYRKWNEIYFNERLDSFRKGLEIDNPADYWFEHEKNMFDSVVIPLSRILHEPGVYGASITEYQQHATRNRLEWEKSGHEVVSQMLANVGRE